MRILSIKHHLSADHSSSTYHFLAADKLTPDERKFVAALTDRQPSEQDLQFHYIGDWQDIPWEWIERLLSGPYDVVVGESYDHWWTRFTLPYDEALYRRIQHFECPNDEDGFEVEELEGKICCTINFHVDYGGSFFNYDEDDVKQIAELFEDIRAEIINGDLSSLRVVYELSGWIDDEDREETADDRVPLSANATSLKSFLTTI